MSGLLDRLERLLDGVLEWGARSDLVRTLLILLVAAVVVLPGLASLPVTDRDEGRFVQASKQMMETGDLIDIRFQDDPRWKKPVGIYWLQSASASVFGGTDAPIWAYRIPSAVSAFLIAVLTAWAAAPLIGRRGASLAGLMMATTLLLAVEGNIAKTDAALTASAVAALGALAHVFVGQGGRGTALVFWLAIAASILLKGPIVPVIALACVVFLWITKAKPPIGKLWLGPGLLLVAALVMPWLIAIWQVSDGAFFDEALGRDLGAKLTSGQEKHWGPPGLYTGLVWATLWPWAALIPVAAPWLWSQRREVWLKLLAGWIIPFWIVLEAVPTKLPHYVLPLYPALVIALAAAVLAGASAARPWVSKLSAVLIALPGLALALAVIVIPLALGFIEIGEDETRLVATLSLPGAALAILGGACTVLAAKAAWQGRIKAQIVASLGAAGLIFPAVLQFGLPGAGIAFPSQAMAGMIAQYRACASGPAFSVGYREPSLVFLTETGLDNSDPEGAAEALRTDPGALVLIEDRWIAILGDKLPETVTRGRITYFNYNRGKVQSATLVTPDDTRWDACTGP